MGPVTARSVVGGAVAAVLLSSCGAGGSDPGPRPAAVPSPTSAPSSSARPSVDTALAELESTYDTRLGVHAVDTGTGRIVSWRAGERFAFASTIKAPLAGAVLDRLSREELSRVVTYDASDLVPYSPITEQHLVDGMTVRELIDAALRYSDNTAANLLFDVIGGPDGLDRALDRLGDRVTDPERTEPDLNTAVPGDPRDTTTPEALATTLRTYLLGEQLPRLDRDFLRTTMVDNTTGDELIRAGVPTDWTVADKTGSADHGVRNDVAVAYPPGRAPIVIAVMSSRDGVDDAHDDRVVASATEIVVDALER